MTDPVMNLWDRAALVPIIEGAGGRITDWQGGDPLYRQRRHCQRRRLPRRAYSAAQSAGIGERKGPKDRRTVPPPL